MQANALTVYPTDDYDICMTGSLDTYITMVTDLFAFLFVIENIIKYKNRKRS